MIIEHLGKIHKNFLNQLPQHSKSFLQILEKVKMYDV